MIGIDIAILLIAIACTAAAYRMLQGPTEADRAIGGDLLMFGVIGLITLFGIRLQNPFTFDIVLVAALVGFLGALSLARALTRGKR